MAEAIDISDASFELGGARFEKGTVCLRPLAVHAALKMADALSDIDPWSTYKISSANLSRYFLQQEAGAPRFGLYVGSELAGVVGVRLNWLRGPYLQFLGVVPEFQGVGAGSLVVAWFEAVVAAKSDENVWIFVSQFNESGRMFYERRGYEVAAQIDDLVGEGQSEILLRKRL